MTGLRTFILDSNVLVYAYDGSARAKQERAREVLAALMASGRGNLSVQVLGEFFNTSTRRIRPPLPIAEAQGIAQNFAAAFPVLTLSDVTVFDAIALVRSLPLSYWDALVLATARENGVDHLISEDLQSGGVYGGVRVVNPFLADFDMSLLS